MKPEFVVLHCTATPDKGDFIGAEQINKWHKMRGWSKIGYHWVIRRSGIIEPGRPENKQGAHVRGHNRRSLGVALVGTRSFTAEQMDSLYGLYFDIKHRWGIEPKSWFGHYELDPKKECPCLDLDALRERLENL